MTTTGLVVPCFNEATRLVPSGLSRLAAQPGLRLFLVDDGSTDGTVDLLQSIRRDHPASEVIEQGVNRGKSEAVRSGLLRATAAGCDVVGFCDADLATPVDEILRLNDIASADPSRAAVLASRVALLGHHVERSPLRHYLGRIFATGASVVLHARVYDTQCGAKFFRNSTMLRAALAEPFNSRWAFDVELLGRLLAGTRDERPIGVDEFLEVPLKVWSDVGGTKLSPVASLRSGAELLVIARALRAWRQR